MLMQQLLAACWERPDRLRLEERENERERDREKERERERERQYRQRPLCKLLPSSTLSRACAQMRCWDGSIEISFRDARCYSWTLKSTNNSQEYMLSPTCTSFKQKKKDSNFLCR
jgi:hypothetical protein